MTKKKELLQAWYDCVWVKGDLDAIDRFFQSSTIATGIIPEMQIGPDDFRDLVTAMLHMVGDVKVGLPVAVEDGDWLSALITVNAVRLDNRAPVNVTGQVMVRFEGDKMVETYNQFDFMGLFEQLGQLPDNTLAICMTGQKLDWA
jgi:hypothetical protein